MATGETTTGSLTDSQPTMIAQARIIREYEGTWRRTCDVVDLAKGTGLSWNEISLAQIDGQDITETTTNENFQQIADTLFTITPSMSQIALKVTDRTYRRIAGVVSSKIEQLPGNAMARKKDEDYLSLFTTFGTGASPGSGNPISFGHIAAAVNRGQSNATEPSMKQYFSILHGFQVKDLQDELVTGVGTYTVPTGMTADTYRQGFKGSVADSNVFVDGNITITSTPDANGATHPKDGVVAVLGMGIKTEKRRDPGFGGGADEIFMTDEYAFGERSAGNWCFRHLSDATAPTS